MRHHHNKAEIFLFGLALMAALFGACLVHASIDSRLRARQLQDKAEMVERLMLTDLALFTEARYTRHLSMADRHSAFQDHPMSLEHFPSGSIAGPPPHLSEGKW